VLHEHVCGLIIDLSLTCTSDYYIHDIDRE